MSEHLEYLVSLHGGKEAAAELHTVESAVTGVGGKIKAVGDESGRAGSKVSGLTGHLKGLAVGLGAMGAAYGAYSAIKGSIDYTRELTLTTEKLHTATGMSTETASHWAGVAASMNVPGTALGMMMTRMSAAITKTREETTKHNSALDKLGLSQEYLNTHAGDFNGIITTTIQKLSEYSGTDKPKMQMELFGRGWQSLAPLIEHGSHALNEALDAAHRFGVELHGNTTQQLEELRKRTEEGKLATDGLKIAFTTMVAGPLGEAIGGFARMASAMREGNWGLFSTEAQKMGAKLSDVLEKVVPKLAETMAKIAPILLESLWAGFKKASLGGEFVIGAVIATKMGLTGTIFSLLGKGLGAVFSGAFGLGMAAVKATIAGAGMLLGWVFTGAFETASLTAMYAWDAVKVFAGPTVIARATMAGSILGTAFEVAFLAGMALLGFELGKMLGEWVSNLHFHFKPGDLLRGKSPLTITEGPSASERSAARDKRLLGANPAGRRFSYLGGPTPHAASGGRMRSAGMVEVGEYGPEMVSLPQNAEIAPSGGGIWGSGDIVIQVDGRELARVQRREALQAAAAGAT